MSHAVHYSRTNVDKLRSDSWLTIGNFLFANRSTTEYLKTMATGWTSTNVSLVYQPTIPNNCLKKYCLLVQQCFKIVGATLAQFWNANPPFYNGFHNLFTVTLLSVLIGIYVHFAGIITLYRDYYIHLMCL